VLNFLVADVNEENKNPERIAILNLIPNTIGDSLLLTPVFRILKKEFPKSSLVVTGAKNTEELFKNNPYIDEILSFKELILFCSILPLHLILDSSLVETFRAVK